MYKRCFNTYLFCVVRRTVLPYEVQQTILAVPEYNGAFCRAGLDDVGAFATKGTPSLECNASFIHSRRAMRQVLSEVGECCVSTPIQDADAYAWAPSARGQAALVWRCLHISSVSLHLHSRLGPAKLKHGPRKRQRATIVRMSDVVRSVFHALSPENNYYLRQRAAYSIGAYLQPDFPRLLFQMRTTFTFVPSVGFKVLHLCSGFLHPKLVLCSNPLPTSHSLYTATTSTVCRRYD